MRRGRPLIPPPPHALANDFVSGSAVLFVCLNCCRARGASPHATPPTAGSVKPSVCLRWRGSMERAVVEGPMRRQRAWHWQCHTQQAPARCPGSGSDGSANGIVTGLGADATPLEGQESIGYWTLAHKATWALAVGPLLSALSAARTGSGGRRTRARTGAAGTPGRYTLRRTRPAARAGPRPCRGRAAA